MIINENQNKVFVGQRSRIGVQRHWYEPLLFVFNRKHLNFHVFVHYWLKMISVGIVLLFCFLSGQNNLFAEESKGNAQAAVKKVRMSHSATHIALESTALGIVDALKDAGYTDALLDIKEESAQGNVVMAVQIAAKFTEQKPDIIFALGTIAAQSFLKVAKAHEVKVMFASVTDPLASKVVDALDCPVYSMSGVSNFVPLAPQIDMIKSLQPHIQSIGILYNSSESNSVFIIEEMRRVCKASGLRLIEQSVVKTGELAQAAARLASRVDAIFISNDNTCLSGFQSIVQAASQARKPVYCSDTDQVEKGALAALGPNQYALGRQAGEMAVRVLKGQPIQSMPVEFPNKTELYINLDAAKTLGISFSQEMREKADVVIQDGKVKQQKPIALKK